MPEENDFGTNEHIENANDREQRSADGEIQEIKLTPYVTAKNLMNRYKFYTLKDTEEILVYDDGVYKPGAEAFIKQETQRRRNRDCTNHFVNEVIGHMKRSTYIAREEFNKDPYILNLKNGLLNVETMEFKEHTPDFLSTIRIPVKYNLNAECPKTSKFISEILHPNDIPVILEWFGYCLILDDKYQKTLMLIGEGSNGKSTLIKLLIIFIGKNNTSSISLHELSMSRFAKGQLYGKLLNAHADISSKALYETGVLKMLTGGDMITADRKFKEPFQFGNYARLMFSANRIPKVPNDDTIAFFRRWILINFPNTFDERTANKNLINELITEKELSGLLNLTLNALNRLLTNGHFSNSKSTEEIKEQYIRLSDSIEVFLNEHCDFNNDYYILTDELYQYYSKYCIERNLPVEASSTFTKKLKSKGLSNKLKRIEKRVVRVWEGINIHPIIQLFSELDVPTITDDSIGL